MTAGRYLSTLLLLGTALAAPESAPAGTAAFTIVDDSALNSAVAGARAEFNATRGGTPRLHACLLVRDSGTTWRRGSYEGTANSYAASTVKLAYLASAMNYARTTGRAYTWLDSSIRPMITVSDNNATGVVVDTVTGAPNTTTGDFTTWVNKRFYTENFLGGRGLLGDQRVLNKTYPTNSGSSPTGYELQALNTYGSNQPEPNLMAELMLEIVQGAIEPGATAYMRDLLTHERFSLQGPFGFGLPPGCIYQNKAGWTTSVLNDVAYVKLPNGKEFILAAYSNAVNGSDPGDYTNAGLGPFMDMVIEKAGLDAGGPPAVRLDNTSSGFATTGTWNTETSDYDKYKTNYRWLSGGTAGTARWNLTLPEAGEYEASLWWTDDSARSSAAKVTVNHAGGAQALTLDQRTRGGMWVPLGKWSFNTTGNSVVIDAGASSAGRVIADGLRLQRLPSVGADNAIDNGTANYAEAGAWGTSPGSGYYGTNSRYANIGTGSVTATWTPPLSSAKVYNVYAWWVASSNRATDAKYVVTHQGGTTTVTVNQQANGGKWNLLGAFQMSPGSGAKVVLSNNASTGSVVSADAVRFVEAAEIPGATIEVVADNGTSAFSASSNWFASTSTPGYYGSNYHARATASVSDSATWTASLPSAGSYQVYARWTAGANRAASAPFVVAHSAGSTTVNVNQQNNNGAWVSLGTYSFNAGSNTVRLSCWTTAGYYVVADAVRWVKQ